MEHSWMERLFSNRKEEHASLDQLQGRCPGFGFWARAATNRLRIHG